MYLMICNYTNSPEPEFSDHTGNKGPVIAQCVNIGCMVIILMASLCWVSSLILACGKSKINWTDCLEHIPQILSRSHFTTQGSSEVWDQVHIRKKKCLQYQSPTFKPYICFRKQCPIFINIVYNCFPSHPIYFCKCINNTVCGILNTCTVKLNKLKPHWLWSYKN